MLPSLMSPAVGSASVCDTLEMSELPKAEVLAEKFPLSFCPSGALGALPT